MRITKAKIHNYRCFTDFEIVLNEDVTIIVGNNEAGKSTILEALNLALTGKINGRSVMHELTPFHFNTSSIQSFLGALAVENGPKPEAPKIIIEVFFADDPEVATFKGRNNSDRDNIPGFTFSIQLDEVEFGAHYLEYIDAPEPRNVPIEYYTFNWIDFGNNRTSPSRIPLDTSLIDATNARYDKGPESFMANLVKNLLTPKESAELRLKHRQLKENFDAEETVIQINQRIQDVMCDISEKKFEYSVDMSSRASWESGFATYLDAVPFALIGKGEQTAIKARLALHRDDEDADCLCLIEEPENHLAFSNMSRLISKIRNVCSGKQLVITTHSSFVANKLGLRHLVLLAAGGTQIKLNNLTQGTQDYFRKLPGYDTLRLLLSSKAILVEGPSDELIVTKAYIRQHGKQPIDDGVDVISVRGLSHKRFLEVAAHLSIKVSAVIDNDGSIDSLERRFVDFIGKDNIDLFWSGDESAPTLEPQLVSANNADLGPLCRALGVPETMTADELIAHMTKQSNKTECALKIFDSDEEITFPEYVTNAVA
jgi:putative ATP-dependent endonuclease of OLD family